MISQSIPQCASSLVTIVVVFVGMLQTSWVLTIVMLFTVTGIVFVTMKVAGKSAKYFVGQQQSLGALNGYVEEMVNGQKVVPRRSLQGAVRQAQRGAVPQCPHRRNPVQHDGSHQQQPWLRPVCHSGHRGRCAVRAVRRQYAVPWQPDELHAPVPFFQHAHQSGLQPDQRHRHGAGRCGAHLRADG